MRSSLDNSYSAPDRSDSNFVSLKALRPVHGESRGRATEYLEAKLIGESEPMQALKRSIRTVASSAETVLITGESGTGKELIARAVHDLGPRRSQPFVAVNCGALTESLLESELFGHVKGSFTGATANKKGFFEAAGDGTILLDEFAEMSLSTQARLLRVLEERTVRPVGLTEAKEISVNARVVVATNHDLRYDISMGTFRNDLYYRVNVLQIRAPSLRDRREDILPLTQHFIRKYNDKYGCQLSQFITSAVLDPLEAYAWPGNVRELENIINRLATNLGEEGILSGSDLLSDPDWNQPKLTSLHQVESAHRRPRESRQIECTTSSVQSVGPCRCRSRKELERYTQLVEEANGNLTEAARRLKIPRTTLQDRLISLRQQCGLSGD